ncbi:MAG: hypothetical protein AUI14_14355 [Actinobacteria bacterium 13_2_20CM_2_71_6]|nr:MAG: hypothetical protein AUI14_14355 [Actinobacteria bacterium 13_2_20CM_2_71_6]
MTVANSARGRARRVVNSGPLEALTRIGFIGYGLLHLAVGWLAIQIALGRPTGESDQSGAFQTLAGQPFGRFLLIVVVVGLAAMAVWQLLLAAVGHQAERGMSRTAERLASLGRTVIYAALSWTAYGVLTGAPTSSAQQQQSATAGILAHPSGRFLVALAGLAVLALGVGMVVYGAKRKFEKRLMTYRMNEATRAAARRLGQAGYIAKGIAFGVVGLLLADAALTNNPGKSRGLDAALRTLVAQPFGVFLLILVAVGFVAFGVYCFVQARYRKVTT